MSYQNNSEFDNDVNVDLEQLLSNTGRVVTLFTTSGGCSGRGFTGLLIEANRCFVKLITRLPSAPRHPFGLNEFNGGCGGFGGFGGGSCCDRSRFGTVIVIPVNRIVAFVFNEV